MSRPLANVVVLVAAGVVLVLEVLALRLAAPYVGLTLETYSAAIGVALLGIAAGAAIGGQLADEVDPRRTLGPTLIAGGVLVLLVPPIVDALGPQVEGRGAWGALALVAAATGPAIVALSMAHPAVVKLRLDALELTGTTVGGLSAVGTIGALGGTFLTGFVLLGELSTRTIALGAGVVIVALGVSVTLALRRERPHGMTLIALPALAILLAGDGPCQRETLHYCARVEGSGAERKALILDDLVHSELSPAHPGRLLVAYIVQFARVVEARWAAPAAIDALHVGGGGFAFPRYLEATRPGSRSVVLELDPGVLALARSELGLVTGERLRVRTGDARMSIRDEPADAYDLVVGDAFASRSVPWHLTTREFLEEVRRVLRRDGIYVMNMIDAGELALVRAELATLRTVFAHVGIVGRGLRGRGNFVLAASQEPLLLPGVALTQAAELVGDAEPLTDDYAPVDQLIGR